MAYDVPPIPLICVICFVCLTDVDDPSKYGEKKNTIIQKLVTDFRLNSPPNIIKNRVNMLWFSLILILKYCVEIQSTVKRKKKIYLEYVLFMIYHASIIEHDVSVAICCLEVDIFSKL